MNVSNMSGVARLPIGPSSLGWMTTPLHFQSSIGTKTEKTSSAFLKEFLLLYELLDAREPLLQLSIL